MNRTSCVWFLIARTIAVKTIPGCPTVELPRLLPLPAPKTQWEARTQATWMEELQVGTAMRDFGSLIDSKRRLNEPFHARRLDSWNASADNLGHLLNVAETMV